MRVASLQRRVRKHWWFLALCIILAGLSAAVNLFVLPTTYAARTRLLLDLPSTSLVAAQQYVLTEINAATSSAILAQAAQAAPGVSQRTLAKEVSANAVSGTDMFEIVVLDTNPTRGAQIANAVAQALIADGQNSIMRMNAAAQAQMQTQVDSAQQALGAARANLQSLRASGASAQQVQAAAATVDDLQARYLDTVSGLVDLQVQQAVNLYGLRVVSAASADTVTPEPSRKLVIGLALLIGLLVGVVGLVASELFTEYFLPIKDLKDAVPWEALGSVRPTGDGGKSVALPDDLEGFEEVSRSLRFLDLALSAHHVAIIGLGRQDGASEIAAGLALASASAGQRTLLVDAAFPHGSQAQRFGVNSQPGLTEALLDAQSQGEATGAAQPANYLQSSMTARLPDLRLLTTGAAPAVAGRVAGAPALRGQIYGLAQRLGASLTLVDVTAPGRVRQMAKLAAGADAVVVAVDLRTARRADVIRMQQALSDAGANVVGCVVARARGAAKRSAMPATNASAEPERKADPLVAPEVSAGPARKN